MLTRVDSPRCEDPLCDVISLSLQGASPPAALPSTHCLPVTHVAIVYLEEVNMVKPFLVTECTAACCLVPGTDTPVCPDAPAVASHHHHHHHHPYTSFAQHNTWRLRYDIPYRKPARAHAATVRGAVAAIQTCRRTSAVVWRDATGDHASSARGPRQGGCAPPDGGYV